MIYLDNAATTKPSESTVEAAERILGSDYFNPSALYYNGINIRKQIDEARTQIADKLTCKPSEIVFTSGATESNNWALSSGFKNKRGNIVIGAGEHPSMYEPAMLLKGKGVDVRVAPLDKDGCVDREKLITLIDADTAFVSVMHVSNETGAVNDISLMAHLAKSVNHKLVFHSDGVQAFCKVPVALSQSDIDLYSISAHKIGGLKGAGALYIDSSLKLSPMIVGGGQEKNLRSGTENVMSILSFATALHDFDGSHVKELYDCAVNVLSKVSGITVNTAKERSSGYIISVGIDGVKSEVLQHILSDEGVLVGTGSACSSKAKKNRTLEAMNVSKRFIDGNIRISFSPSNTAEEVRRATDIIIEKVSELRSKIHG